MTLNQTLDRLRHVHGPKFDESFLAPDFKPYFHGPRIEVRSTLRDGTTFVRRGRVSITTGWLPVFILLPRRDSRSSSDVLTDTDEILRVIPDWRDRSGRGCSHLYPTPLQTRKPVYHGGPCD